MPNAATAKRLLPSALRGDGTCAARQLGVRLFLVSASEVATPPDGVAANKGYPRAFSSVRTKTISLRAIEVGGNNLPNALLRSNLADSLSRASASAARAHTELSSREGGA